MNWKYNHQESEKKWQKYWSDNKTFKAEIDHNKPKYYVLDMFPYPSGAGLHVGHVLGYTATDIIARHKRKLGFNVLHPMGWDSFGLPAEQYAIRTGTHPAETTKKNINNFRRQLQMLGFSYDWDREITTSSSKYYKWTQWIFTKLYEKGLAYEAEMMVNYCPDLGTVLANEEVENGKAKEGGYLIERRPLRQWVLKITEYADKLIEDLELVDWPEGLKKAQINWIGRSEGAKVVFTEKNSHENITVFTTRPDTLFGATYIVLSPEHSLVDRITTKEQREIIKSYQQETLSKSDLERTELSKEKTGAFTGAYAINPVNNKEIPIWISDYVLASYGTGAIMAVPAHDERDFEFANKFGINVIPVFDPHVIDYPELIPENISKEEIRNLVLQGKFCWTGNGKCINSNNAEISINGLNIAEAKKTITDWLESKNLGKKDINYKLRDWLFSRQRYWGEPFPILHFEDGSKRTLDVSELPLCPPELNDFKPCGDGKSPLAKVDSWVNINDSKTNRVANRETNTMPQWAGSCWYYLRFCDPNNDNAAWDKEAEKYWMPVDMYIGGVEHAVLHLLYARFWHKVLYDCGLVSTPEPFHCLRNQGLITAPSYQKSTGSYIEPEMVEERNGLFYSKENGEKISSQVEKMSKSKLNGVIPDEIIHDMGADALRLYEMFMGPLEKEKIWNSNAVHGCRRFLDRLYNLSISPKLTDEENERALKLGHRLIDGICKDIEAMQFNTVISKAMEFVNEFSKLEKYPKTVVAMAAHAIYAIAPHIAEEIWNNLGHSESITYVPYPTVDPKYLIDDMVTYIVQINGKVRARLELSPSQSEEDVFNIAIKNNTIAKYLEGKEIRKQIFVQNKLLSLVI